MPAGLPSDRGASKAGEGATSPLVHLHCGQDINLASVADIFADLLPRRLKLFSVLLD